MRKYFLILFLLVASLGFSQSWTPAGVATGDGGIKLVETGTASGTIGVDGSDVAVKGLDTAAYKKVEDFAPAGNYAGSASAGGAANSVANSFTLTLDGGTDEGTDKFTFDGSVAKTVDIPKGGSSMPSKLENQYRFTMAMSWVRGDYESAEVATYTDGPSHGKGTGAFYGSTLLPNGKIMLTPGYSANIGIYDPVENTYTNGPAHGKTSNAFTGSVLMPNGKVMLTPVNSANIGIYDPVANTYTDGPAHGRGYDAFQGSVLLPNGKVMLTPNRSVNIGIYDPKLDVSAVKGLANYLRLPFFNKF